MCEETKTERGEVICSGLYRQQIEELYLNPDFNTLVLFTMLARAS